MNLKKIIAFICIVVLAFSMVAVPVSGESTGGTESNIVSYINENFEDGNISDWAYRDNVAGGSSGTKSAVVAQENNNKFLRMSYSGTHVDGIGKVVMFSKKFADGIFDMPDDGITVIEYKLRTNSKTLRKQFKFNYPKSGEYEGDCYNEFAWNTRAVALFHSDGNASYFSANAPGNAYFQGQFGTLLQGYSVNTWYTIKMVMNYKTEKVYFYLYNQSGTLVGASGVQDMSAWWFKYHDQDREYPISDYIIDDFSILFRNGSTVTDERVDIDDFKIYTQTEQVGISVLPNTDEGVIFKPDRISFVFDAPVNISENGIRITDAVGNVIEHTPSYDESKLCYTAVFDSALAAGTYKIRLDADKVIPVNGISEIISAMSLKSDEFEFSSYDTMPPVVLSASVNGRIIPGETLIADYEYASEAQEGVSIYEWLASDTADGDFSVIENASFKELEITENLVGKYIKFAVTPVDVNGLTGERKESGVVIPEVAPEAKNVTLSSDALFTNSYISVEYEYYDANGDEETKSEIVWYISDDGIGGWTRVGEKKYFNITDEMKEKYLKCVVTPVNSSAIDNRGIPAESAVSGPVGDVLAVTNKFVNGGLETGELAPFTSEIITDAGSSYKGIELSEESYRGNYSLLAHSRPTVNERYYQPVQLENGKTYLLSAMVKSADGTKYPGYEGYIWKGSGTRPYRDREYVEISSVWKRVTLTMNATSGGLFHLGFLTFTNPNKAIAYVDDHYVGELLITDIETAQLTPTTIPTGDNKTTINVIDGNILNQFGDTAGLYEQTAEVKVPNVPGLTVMDNKIIVSSQAVAGIYDIEVICTPTYPGAAQSVFTKIVELELVAHDDKTPAALNVTASGIVSEGNTLTGTYDFYQVEGKTNASSVRWMYSDSADGVYYDIPGAVSDTYVVESAYADKFIKFAVTPKTVDGLVGKGEVSAFIVKPMTPTASKIRIAGDFKIGGSITGSFDFYDINNDDAGQHLYKWYVADSKDGAYTAIANETDRSLVLGEEYAYKYLKLGVTPVSVSEPYIGAEVLSDAYTGPVAPVAKDVYIQNVDGILTGNYTYYHEHYANEAGTLYRWTVDGATVSTQQSYVPDFYGTKTVSFTVTPIGNTNPSTGSPVTVTATVNGLSQTASGVVGGFVGGGSSGGSAGGFSGGGASGGSAGGIASVNNMVLPELETEKNNENENTETASDIDGHWGEEYIKTMLSRGVMAADENGKYNPDEIVTREDMLTFLFKTLKLETSEYSGMFEDVKDSEFASMLQTMVDNGTISNDTTFRPNDSISREEMCKILYISLDNAGKLDIVEDDVISTLSDYSLISDWAVKYVNAMYKIKMMIGVSEDRFAPGENVTKAQAATMLVRIISYVEGK